MSAARPAPASAPHCLGFACKACGRTFASHHYVRLHVQPQHPRSKRMLSQDMKPSVRNLRRADECVGSEILDLAHNGGASASCGPGVCDSVPHTNDPLSPVDAPWSPAHSHDYGGADQVCGDDNDSPMPASASLDVRAAQESLALDGPSFLVSTNRHGMFTSSQPNHAHSYCLDTYGTHTTLL